ncbi:alpha/beta hydrolase [Pseudohalocynthiibacter sp. F2068]|jgi:esterase/lipase superfamily enzyme|nr:alpha/beta hydrolase [Pseudohalocynthiibacter sp. F2068]
MNQISKVFSVIVPICWSSLLPMLAVVFTLLLLGACEKVNRLAQAPTIYVEKGSYPESEVPEYLRTVSPDILFVTDRRAVTTREGKMNFSHERSPAMAFGRIEVNLAPGWSWSDLLQEQSANRNRMPAIVTGDAETLVQFSPTPLPFELKNGVARPLPSALAPYQEQKRAFQRRVSAELKRANRRDVVIFIHGFNNGFDDGVTTLANIWHSTGRIGVPIVYSWPADSSGLFGYFTDRESGEFSIFHLKEFLRALSSVTELERIHLIAHSRGTDVATSALRELVIAERAAGRDPRRSLKLDTLILAAPDLDFGVVCQRLIAEQFGPAFGQIIVYMNSKDGALGLSQTLMAGLRFGRISSENLGESERVIFKRIQNVNFIEVEQVRGQSGHAYFRENPAVLSDIALALRTGALPGSSERPLTRIDGNFWQLRKDYPLQVQ